MGTLSKTLGGNFFSPNENQGFKCDQMWPLAGCFRLWNKKWAKVMKQMHMGGSKKWGYPKMDGENNGKPKNKMDDLGGKPTILGNPHMHISSVCSTTLGFFQFLTIGPSFVSFFLGVLPPRSCSFLSEFGILTASLSVKPETAPAGRNHNGSSEKVVVAAEREITWWRCFGKHYIDREISKHVWVILSYSMCNM